MADKHPGESGFYPLSWGVDALAARLVLAERAELSIDAQYYHVTDDIVSQCFFDALLRAADRGVLVRLLIDDVFTKGKDCGLAGLDSHPNFSVRSFQPFCSPTRAIHRWHNGFSPRHPPHAQQVFYGRWADNHNWWPKYRGRVLRGRGRC